VDHVVVSLDLLKGLEVVSEMAGFSIRAVAILVELFAFLRLGILLGVHSLESDHALAAHLLPAVSELAVVSIAAGTSLSEMFAQSFLVDVEINFLSVKVFVRSERRSFCGVKCSRFLFLVVGRCEDTSS
jgi:hypothetical protein